MPNVNSQTIYQMGSLVNDVVKQATGRDPVQSIEMANVTVAQNTLLGIETLSGSVVRFRTPKSVPLLTLEAQIVAQQNLHGYDYPWPAGGGKNLLNPDALTLAGTVVFAYRNTGFLFLANTTYTFSVDINIEPASISIYSVDEQTQLMYATNTNKISYTPTENTYGVPRLYYADSISLDQIIGNIMLEKGTTRTDYEPYANICPITGFTGCNITVSDGDTTEHVYPVEWETEAGTVYGGVLDAKNGKLTVKWKGVDLGDYTYTPYSSGPSRDIYSHVFEDMKPIETVSTPPSFYSSIYKTVSTNSVWAPWQVSVRAGVPRIAAVFIVPHEQYADETEFKSAMDGVQFVYELAEPVEYDVTPVSINTLAGDNVISADTGDISLSYYVYSDLL